MRWSFGAFWLRCSLAIARVDDVSPLSPALPVANAAFTLWLATAARRGEGVGG